MDKELIILEHINNNSQVNQRDLATVAQSSLGMTNAILKRFAQKGFITISKVNNRNIRYALTAAGLEEIKKRSWAYFKRTLKNVVSYQDVIQDIVRQAKLDGYTEIKLIGQSDLAFIIEHVCYKENIHCYIRDKVEDDRETNVFYLYAESSTLEVDDDICSFSLSRLIMN